MARNQLMMELHWLRWQGRADVSVSAPAVDQDGVDMIISEGFGDQFPIQLKAKNITARTRSWEISGSLVYPRDYRTVKVCDRSGGMPGGFGGALVVQVIHPLPQWPYVRAWYRVGNVPIAALKLGRGKKLISLLHKSEPLGPRMKWPSSLLTAPRDAEGMLHMIGFWGGGTWLQKMLLDGYPSPDAMAIFQDAEREAKHKYDQWRRALTLKT
jgi:hypothetical protein